jgi:magnesium-transporting ATPase (P-type)
MRKITGKILNAAKNAKNTSGSDPENNQLDTLDAFYHRMFERDIYLHISEISVMMVGVCLTGVSIMQVDEDIQDAGTYIDDLLAIDSCIFLIAALIAYWVIRVTTHSNRNVRKVGNIANIIFLIGMIVIVIVCLSIVIQADFSPATGK